MKLDKSQILIASLLSITTCSGLVLSMSHTYADNSVTDNITITVPEACSISSTIDTAHTATFSAGTWSGAEGSDYENGIGKTTLTTFCNDNNGFSIYAIGFTNDTLGTTTLVGSNTNIAIPTKAYASGDTTSNWSMKITKVENPVSGDPVTWNPNNLTISDNFDSWHAVPDDYTKVAEYKAQTGSSTTDTVLGAKLETTYATFISPTQPADTYTGKVKYVMVHPHTAAPPSDGITVTYNGNDLTFPGGATTNTVTYGRDCTAEDSYYIGNTPRIVKSPNIADDGTQNGPYYTDEDIYILEHVSFPGASRIKVVLKYGLTADNSAIEIIEGVWNNTDNRPEEGTYHEYYSETDNQSGTETLIINEDTITILMEGWGTPETGYDYGMYAEIYPIYDSETSCPIGPMLVGTYAEPTGFGYWYLGDNVFLNEANIMDYINQNPDTASIAGLTINASDKSMQNVFSWGSSVQEGQEITAIDARDGKSYTVARLADGNLWMTQNLDHDIVTTPGFYTNQNTDLGWNTSTNSYDQASWDPVPSAYTHDGTSQYEWVHYGDEFPDYDYGEQYEGWLRPESYDPSDLYWNEETRPKNQADCEDAGMSWYDDECHGSIPPSVTGDSHYHLGNYYSWTAAMAMNDSREYTIDYRWDGYKEPNQSICPKGWTLPQSGNNLSSGSFQYLIEQYNWDSSTYEMKNPNIWDTAIKAPLSGYYGLVGLSDIGVSGGFLSPVIGNADDTPLNIGLQILQNDNKVYPDGVLDYRGTGYSVRCIARPVSNTLVTDEP